MQTNARALAEKLQEMGRFEVIGSDEEQLPLVAFKLAQPESFDEFDIAWQLSAERGWMVPAYTLPADAQDVKIMRALVKQTMSREHVDTLARDIEEALATLDAKGGAHPSERQKDRDRTWSLRLMVGERRVRGAGPGTSVTPQERLVRALPAGSRWTHQPVRMGEWVRDRFWSIPLALIVGGVLIAVVVSRPELLGLPEDWGFGNLARTSTADAMLQVMASSMLTFVGVVFAITLVGLQLASSQLSPRVIRTFVRSSGHEDGVRRLPCHLRLRRDRPSLRQSR